jgi:ABC-type multidrug transport system ATPase subunit
MSVRIRRTLAIDAVDLDLGPGVHAVLGSNGSGKTTLLRTLATAAAPSEGTLRLLDRDPGGSSLREIRRRLGYLPQSFGLYRSYTVREFLGYAAWLKEMPGRRIPAAVEEAAERIGLMHRIDARIRTLSGGMRQRVGIAQAIVNEPELLILDEPDVGLDAGSRADFVSLLQHLADVSCVVISTHTPEEIHDTCSTATVLDRGKVAFHGSPTEMAAYRQRNAAPQRPMRSSG